MDILNAIKELTNAKQMDREELRALLQDGILAALGRKYGPTVEAEVDIDETKGEIRIVRLRTVSAEVTDPIREVTLEEARFLDESFEVGDVMETPIEFAEFGRTAVQAAKQRILQRVREGERTKIKDEFSGRVGDLFSGEVQQIERGKLVLMLNRHREAEAIIPYREQNHREHYHQGETIRAVLKKVEDTPKGPRLVFSRSDPLFVQALFKLEVPEIQQSVVEIRAAAREVGSRTKIAVFSRDDAIDPVGACVGLKGARVQAVVNELGGERIDIVPWSADPERFAKLALAPAKVARVFSDPATKTIQAVVDEDQLSLESAATARTCASRRNSPAGRSTCTRVASGSSGPKVVQASRRCRRNRSPTCRSPRSKGCRWQRSPCWRQAGTARSTILLISSVPTSSSCQVLRRPRRIGSWASSTS